MRAALTCAALFAGGALLSGASDWALYRASIAAADGALRLHETSAAWSWLEAAPVSERGWEWRYLRALADQSRLVVRAHDAPITGVAVGADGRTVATTSVDRTVRLWDAATGAAGLTLTGAGGTTWSPALRRGARHVAAISSDGALRVWDVGSAATAAAPVAVFERIGRGLGATAWSPDGSLLAAATWTVEPGRGVQGWVHLWHFDDRRLLWKAPYGVKPIAALAFSPDGRQLVAGTWDGRLGWFAAPGDGSLARDVEIAAVDGGYTAVQSVAFAADGRELLVGAKDGLARVFDAADGRLRRTYPGHARWINGVASLSPSWDVTASTDETIRLWQAGSTRPHRVLHGHRAAISGVAALPGGGVVSADADGALRWWDAGVADVSRVVWRGTEGETGIYGVAFTADGRRAATAAWGGAVTLRDADTGRAVWTKVVHKTSANAVAFHPAGTHVVSSGSDGRLAILALDGAAGPSWSSGAARQVDSVAWSADGRLIASASAPPTATLWDAATGAAVRTIPARTGTVTAVAFGRGGRVAAVASSGDVALASAGAGDPIIAAAAHPGGAHAVAFSPDGSLLATAGADRRVRLWRVPDLAPLRELRGHAEQVTGLAFSPDGRRLASSSNDQTVRLWSPATGELVLTIPFGEQVYGVRFTPDGRRLAVLPLDGTVRLLEAPSYH